MKDRRSRLQRTRNFGQGGARICEATGSTRAPIRFAPSALLAATCCRQCTYSRGKEIRRSGTGTGIGLDPPRRCPPGHRGARRPGARAPRPSRPSALARNGRKPPTASDRRPVQGRAPRRSRARSPKSACPTRARRATRSDSTPTDVGARVTAVSPEVRVTRGRESRCRGWAPRRSHERSCAASALPGAGRASRRAVWARRAGVPRRREQAGTRSGRAVGDFPAGGCGAVRGNRRPETEARKRTSRERPELGSRGRVRSVREGGRGGPDGRARSAGRQGRHSARHSPDRARSAGREVTGTALPHLVKLAGRCPAGGMPQIRLKTRQYSWRMAASSRR